MKAFTRLASIDDHQAISDAIGNLFDTLVTERRPSRLEPDDEAPARWRAKADQLPRKIQVDSAQSLYDSSHSFRIFGA